MLRVRASDFGVDGPGHRAALGADRADPLPRLHRSGQDGRVLPGSGGRSGVAVPGGAYASEGYAWHVTIEAKPLLVFVATTLPSESLMVQVISPPSSFVICAEMYLKSDVVVSV